MRPPLAWGLLLTLLAALLAGALTFDRRTWGAFVGDEATYLMAAQSLIWDGDLTYSTRDYDRFVATWGSPPEGLILQRGSAGSPPTYAKEAIYPLALAPLTRLAPTRAAPITNALALALASVLAAQALRRSLGPAAPLWVAVLVFASVTFGHVYWAHADLLLLCLVVIACALLRLWEERLTERAGLDRHRLGNGRRLRSLVVAWQCVVAGALLGTVVAARPPYLPLLAAAAMMLPLRGRRAGGAALVLGALLPFALGVWLNLAARGVLSSYQGERRAFYSYTGFPGEGAAGDAWESHAQEHGSGSWIETPAPQLPFVTAQQLGWNGVYFVAGRTVGVLPYFLPLLAMCAAFRPRGGRLALVLAAITIALLFLLLRPFNFWGGGGALANRYFLPVTGALWFVAARPLKARWAVLTVLCAAPFLWPLWLAPRAFPMAPDGTLRHVAPLARWLLPHETTQSHLKPGGREDVVHGGLWVKFLSPTIHSETADATLVLEGRGGELLLGSATPIEALAIEVLEPVGARVRLSGSAQGEVEAGTKRRLPLHLRARHPMWWTTAPFHLYEIRLERSPATPSGPIRFQLRPPT